MGAVYEVEHARTGEHLALKVLLSGVGASADNLERFKREARASARIKSDHVVRVTDADVAPELDGAPFLVMELLEGMDLERKAATGRPDPAMVVEWLRQVAVAIDKAHRLGIVHRDLKPENLFLTTGEDRPPIIKVLDFGIVKLAEEGTGATGSGQIIGTPRYMAPEQASSSGRVTPATDRFALGLVAYRLLAGESYFRGDPINVLAQILHEPMRPPSEKHPELGKAFDTWFARACHREPEQRFSSAAEQVEALAAALALPTIAATPGAMRQPSRAAPTTQKVTRSQPLLRIVIGVVVVGAAVGGVLIAMPSGRPVATTPSAPSALPIPAIQTRVLRTPEPKATPPAPPPPVAAPPVVAAPAPVTEAARPRPRVHAKTERPPAVTTEHPAPKSPTADPYADQK